MLFKRKTAEAIEEKEKENRYYSDDINILGLANSIANTEITRNEVCKTNYQGIDLIIKSIKEEFKELNKILGRIYECFGWSDFEYYISDTFFKLGFSFKDYRGGNQIRFYIGGRSELNFLKDDFSIYKHAYSADSILLAVESYENQKEEVMSELRGTLVEFLNEKKVRVKEKFEETVADSFRIKKVLEKYNKL